MRQLSSLLLAGVITLYGQGVMAAPEKFDFDKAHTNILFSVNHLGLSNFYGQFNDFDGQVVFDQEQPANSKVEITIKTASVDTDVPDLDKHLMAEDFFDAAKYPDIRFKSNTVVKAGRNRFHVTLHGVTREVTLLATLNYAGEHPLSKFLDKYKGAYYAGFSATAVIRRSEFGITSYVPNVADEVNILIETELRRR
jgi:polyisoprenoid-binding protein YceI